MFYSRTKKRATEPTTHGEKERKTYSIKISEYGHKEVYQSGKTNQYEKTQEAAESTKISNIVKRVSLGDTTAINKAYGMYLDTTNLPSNLAQAQTALQNVENIFNTLPVEARAEYGHDINKFIADYGSEKFLNIITPKEVKIAERNKIEIEKELTEKNEHK